MRIAARTGAPGHLVRPSQFGASVRPTIAAATSGRVGHTGPIRPGVVSRYVVARHSREPPGASVTDQGTAFGHSMTVRAPRIPDPGHEPSNHGSFRPAGSGRATAGLIAPATFFDRSPGFPGGDLHVPGRSGGTTPAAAPETRHDPERRPSPGTAPEVSCHILVSGASGGLARSSRRPTRPDPTRHAAPIEVVTDHPGRGDEVAVAGDRRRQPVDV